MKTRSLLVCPTLLALLGGSAAAQSAPSSIDADYHHGWIYWEPVGGSFEQASHFGSLTFTSANTVSGSGTTFEESSTGSFTISEGFGPVPYTIETSGQLAGLLEFTEGGETFRHWVSQSEDVIHMARSTLIDPADFSVAIKKSSGLDDSALSGTYRYVFFGFDWVNDPAGPVLEKEVGRIVFDGAGTATAMWTETEVQNGSSSSASPPPESYPYSVAPDGTFEIFDTCGAGVPTLNCDVGAITSDGEFGFAVAGSDGTGLMMIVRENADPDLSLLASRYGYTANATVSRATANSCVAGTLLGIANAAATTSNSGTWAGDELWIESSAAGGVTDSFNQAINGTLEVNGGAVETFDDLGLLSTRTWVSSDYRYVLGDRLAIESGDSAIGVFLATRMGGGSATRYCSPGALNSTGAAASIDVSGSLIAAQNDLVLQATSLPPSQFGIFIVAPSQGFLPGINGTSNGNLCLSGSVGRYRGPGQILATGSGSFSLPIDLTAIPQGSSTVATSPGQSWNFQAWFRDGVGLGSNLTDAIQVVFE